MIIVRRVILSALLAPLAASLGALRPPGLGSPASSISPSPTAFTSN